MIFTDRTITVRKGESRIDEPIVVYRGDYELEVRFTILNSRFKFMSGTNMIESEKASYGQLAILTPYGGNIFSDIVRCNDGSVTFVLTADMLNQIEEVGLYSFQIRLMDYNKESRVSIPPIEYGIEVREPIASEDHDNSVNNAIVGYSIAKVVDPKEEKVGDTFDESGNYNKTKWETGDRISEGKLNKIEDAIDTINRNEKNDSASLSKRIDNNFNILDSTKVDKVELDLQTKRIDSFIGLEDGSTTGDAELMDGRIGWDGRVYNNLGNAIREQLKTSMKQYIALPFNLTENYFIDYSNGDLTYHKLTVFNASDFIKILPQSRTIFIDNLVYNAVDKGGLAFYNSSYEYISGHQYGHVAGSLQVIAPDDATYMRFTYKNETSNDMGSVVVYQDGIEIISNINEVVDDISDTTSKCKYILRNNIAYQEASYIEYETGVASTYGDISHLASSDYIHVNPNSEVIINNLNYYSIDKTGLAFYDENKNFIKGVQYQKMTNYSMSLMVPMNCKFMRISALIKDLDRIDILNDSLYYLRNDISDTTSKCKYILRNNIAYQEASYIEYETGVVSTYEDISHLASSDYIHVNPNSEVIINNLNYYSIDKAGLAFYDENKNFIKGVQYQKMTNYSMSLMVPMNCKFMRISALIKDLDRIDILNDSLYYLRNDISDTTSKCKYILRNNIAYQEASYIEYETGVASTYGDISHLASSDYIHVNPNSEVIINNLNYYSIDKAGLAFYDENKNFIKGVQYQKMTNYSMSLMVPMNCKFMRISALIKDLDRIDILNDSLYYLRNDINDIKNNKNNKNNKKYNYCKMFHKIAGIGDSLMSGAIAVWYDEKQAYGFIDCYNYSWLSNLCRDMGAEAIHYSRGGSTTKTWLDEYLDDMKSETEKPSAYFIALGTNDSNRDVVLGEESDCGTINDTFYGNYSRIIDEIKGFNPNAVIFCLSLYFVESDRSVLFSDAIRRIAELKSCYYVDFLNSHSEYSSDVEIRSKYVFRGHFTTLGYIRVGEEILELVNSVIDENAADLRVFSRYFMNLS